MAGERVQKMDVKKNRLSASSRADGRKAITFVSEVRQELKRVEWTSKDEIKSYTKIVLASTLVFAMFVYFTDLIIQGVLGLINLIVKFFI
jgi:preprotein translocase subunit SecE